MGTWNVYTMVQAGKLQEVANEVFKYNVNITTVQ